MVSGFSEALLLEAERHAAWGAAQLDALTQFLPDGPWTADLPSCLYRQGGLELRVAVLGTYDMEEQSWMWGWANPGLRGTEVVALTTAVERYGRAHGIPELTADVLPLSGFDDPRHAAELLAFTGMGVAEAPGYIGVPAGPATQVYFLPDDTQVPRAGPRPGRTAADAAHRRRSDRPRAPAGRRRLLRPPRRAPARRGRADRRRTARRRRGRGGLRRARTHRRHLGEGRRLSAERSPGGRRGPTAAP
ncbi:hypothetical protein SGLAM104S_05941 [Streptomyces glaucescens]